LALSPRGISPDGPNPKFPFLNDLQQKERLLKLSESYGKVILDWNPIDTILISHLKYNKFNILFW
jgi:hypothetical protein